MNLPPIYIIISGIFVSSLAFLRCIIHPPKLQPQDECIDEFHIGVVECHIMRRRGHYLKIIAHHGKIAGQIRCNPWHVSSYEYNNICYTLLFYNYRRPTNRGWETRGVETSSPIAHRCTPPPLPRSFSVCVSDEAHPRRPRPPPRERHPPSRRRQQQTPLRIREVHPRTVRIVDVPMTLVPIVPHVAPPPALEPGGDAVRRGVPHGAGGESARPAAHPGEAGGDVVGIAGLVRAVHDPGGRGRELQGGDVVVRRRR